MTNFEIVETGKAGRPSKYSPAVVDRLLASLAAGLTQKQACMACGICQNTLTAWRREYEELEPRIEAAREVARQTALEGIKTAGEKDWRALAEWLKLTFPEYRSGSNINVNATATGADNRTVVVTEETRKRLQTQLKEIQDADESDEQSYAPITLPAPQAQLQANVGAGIAHSGASTVAHDSIFIMPGGEGVPSPTLRAVFEYEPPQPEPERKNCAGW